MCIAAGIYNETAFRGLDFVLDQAAQFGVKVMFTLTNNWKTFDSKYNVRIAPGPILSAYSSIFHCSRLQALSPVALCS